MNTLRNLYALTIRRSQRRRQAERLHEFLSAWLGRVIIIEIVILLYSVTR